MGLDTLSVIVATGEPSRLSARFTALPKTAEFRATRNVVQTWYVPGSSRILTPSIKPGIGSVADTETEPPETAMNTQV